MLNQIDCSTEQSNHLAEGQNPHAEHATDSKKYGKCHNMGTMQQQDKTKTNGTSDKEKILLLMADLAKERKGKTAQTKRRPVHWGKVPVLGSHQGLTLSRENLGNITPQERHQRHAGCYSSYCTKESKHANISFIVQCTKLVMCN
eukprot:1157389-Pelagomonas_calceolata.AAC.1